jgi:hypothetical protein
MRKAFTIRGVVLAAALLAGASGPSLAQSGDPWTDCIRLCNKYYPLGSELWHLCRNACGPPPAAPQWTDPLLATLD